jgi:hypothetical protein
MLKMMEERILPQMRPAKGKNVPSADLESLETRNFFPDLIRNVTRTQADTVVVNYTHHLSRSAPVVALIHDIPQSAYA